MISKNYRLIEKDVKKVLQKWKPFFSYWIVLNYSQNSHPFNRFGIIVSWKSVSSWVERNFFRRLFFNAVQKSIWVAHSDTLFYDLVFVVKKQTKLDKKSFESINTFEKDTLFLLKKLDLLK